MCFGTHSLPFPCRQTVPVTTLSSRFVRTTHCTSANTQIRSSTPQLRCTHSGTNDCTLEIIRDVRNQSHRRLSKYPRRGHENSRVFESSRMVCTHAVRQTPGGDECSAARCGLDVPGIVVFRPRRSVSVPSDVQQVHVPCVVRSRPNPGQRAGNSKNTQVQAVRRIGVRPRARPQELSLRECVASSHHLPRAIGIDIVRPMPVPLDP